MRWKIRMKKSHKQIIIGVGAVAGTLFTVNELMRRGIIPNPFLTKGRQTEVAKQTNLGVHTIRQTTFGAPERRVKASIF